MIAFSVSVTCGIFLTAKPTIAFVGHHWRLALSSVAIVIVGTALMYFWPKHVVKPQIEVIQPSPSPIPETSVSVPLDELDQVPPKKKDQNAIKPPPGYVLDSKTK
jgi:hypothetical protein